MATINNIKKRASEIKNAYEPESVTAEKVGQLFEDIADVTEQTITSSEEVMQESVRASEAAAQAASEANERLSDLQDAIENLPDGQAVSAQVAVNKTDIAGLKSKTDSISKQSTESEEEALVFETDGGTQVGKIDANGADFTNLKRGGQQVARMSDLPTVPAISTDISADALSNTKTASPKAVKDYVDAHQLDLPITEETAQSETDEVEFGNDAGSQTYAKIGDYGIKSKAYLDMQGNSVIPTKDTSIGSSPSQTNVPTSKAVADYVEDYVDEHGGGVGDMPISEETTQSEEEEVAWGDDNDTEVYAKVNHNGLYAKRYFDLSGREVVQHVFYCGSTRQYTKVKDVVAEAVKYQDSIVYFDAEDFDILAEYGQSYLESLSPQTCGMWLKNGIHLIGTAGTRFLFLYNGSSNTINQYFSMFNSEKTRGTTPGGNGYTIENVAIETKNCRYCVHDDRDTDPQIYYNRFINCSFKHDNSTNPNWSSSQCIGGGFGQNTNVIIENCHFESYGATTNGYGVSYHNTGSTSLNSQSKLIITGCWFNTSCVITNYGDSTKVSTMLCSNCSVGTELPKASFSSNHPRNVEAIVFNVELRNN